METYKVVLYCLLILSGTCLVLMRGDFTRRGLVYFILTLGLGYRTWPITRDLRIIPAEIVIWLVLLYQLPYIHRPLRRFAFRLPAWILASIPFWVGGWIMQPV